MQKIHGGILPVLVPDFLAYSGYTLEELIVPQAVILRDFVRNSCGDGIYAESDFSMMDSSSHIVLAASARRTISPFLPAGRAARMARVSCSSLPRCSMFW